MKVIFNEKKKCKISALQEGEAFLFDDTPHVFVTCNNGNFVNIELGIIYQTNSHPNAVTPVDIESITISRALSTA